MAGSEDDLLRTRAFVQAGTGATGGMRETDCDGPSRGGFLARCGAGGALVTARVASECTASATCSSRRLGGSSAL